MLVPAMTLRGRPIIKHLIAPPHFDCPVTLGLGNHLMGAGLTPDFPRSH